MKNIKAKELKKLLDKGGIKLIDVREPAEHRCECIAGSACASLSSVEGSDLSNVKKVVVFCKAGGRSAEAAKKLLEKNPELEVYSLEGGIEAWKEAGFDVERLGGSVIPLDRQVLIAAGLFTFIGTILGHTASSNFYIVPAFMGLGLMFAGVTGICTLSKVLAKMPWNQ